MIDRRRLLVSASAAAGLSAAPLAALARTRHAAKRAAKPAAAASDEEARLNAVLDAIFQEQLKVSPELATNLGLDKGPNAGARFRLDDSSTEAVLAYQRSFNGWAKDLRAIDRAKLTGMAGVNYDTVLYFAELVGPAADKFTFGVLTWPSQAFTAPSPYVVSQLTGAYAYIPDFLDSQAVVADQKDAEAYLARLNAFATVLDQETARVREDAAAGVTPPDFIIDTTLAQLTALRKGLGPDSILVTSLVRRTREKHVMGDWGARATKIVDGAVTAALDRQIAVFQGLRANAVHDAGVSRLKDGEAYYRWALKYNTTTDLPPEEVHMRGLEQVNILSGRIDAVFKSQGMSQGTVGQRLSALAKDPRFLYPNTEAGKTQLLADLNALVRAMEGRLPQYFGALPKAQLEIRRVPPANEAGAPGGYYQGGSLDGLRPGAYYINLRDTAEWPKWTLPTLTYHEGIPGHHLQITLANEATGIPPLRKAMGFNAYQEGWALYAEQLADEMGVYANDPFGQIGYLHDALLRAVRLVVDTGLHSKRWSREQAIRYMTEQLGEPESPNVTEVERYCVWPGQACSYMIGKLTWLRLRENAKTKMGARFDIRGFHDAGLLSGAMPLDVLEHVIDGWAAGPG